MGPPSADVVFSKDFQIRYLMLAILYQPLRV
jgi:hypothetical protein